MSSYYGSPHLTPRRIKACKTRRMARHSKRRPGPNCSASSGVPAQPRSLQRVRLQSPFESHGNGNVMLSDVALFILLILAAAVLGQVAGGSCSTINGRLIHGVSTVSWHVLPWWGALEIVVLERNWKNRTCHYMSAMTGVSSTDDSFWPPKRGAAERSFEPRCRACNISPLKWGKPPRG